MTKKEKRKLIKEIDERMKEFFIGVDNFSHSTLCSVLGTKQDIWVKWEVFYDEITNFKFNYATLYFEHNWSIEEAALLRLLIVEDFKQWIREL